VVQEVLRALVSPQSGRGGGCGDSPPGCLIGESAPGSNDLGAKAPLEDGLAYSPAAPRVGTAPPLEWAP